MKKILNEIVRETLLSHCSPMKGVTVDGGEGYFIPLNSLGPLTVATNSRVIPYKMLGVHQYVLIKRLRRL